MADAELAHRVSTTGGASAAPFAVSDAVLHQRTYFVPTMVRITCRSCQTVPTSRVGFLCRKWGSITRVLLETRQRALKMHRALLLLYSYCCSEDRFFVGVWCTAVHVCTNAIYLLTRAILPADLSLTKDPLIGSA